MWSLHQVWALLVLLPCPCTAKRVTFADEQALNFSPSVLGGMSAHRRSCLAQDDLDSRVCPPERCHIFSIRMAIAGLPIGDAYVVVEKLQIISAQARVIVQRKSDTSFSFEVAGVNDGQALGNAKLWYDGMQFLLPHTSIGQHAKNVAGLESFFVGWAVEDYGRLDKGKVNVDFNMSADFELDGTRWKLVNGTQKQTVNIKAGAGGLIQTIANTVIAKMGGIDTMFFNLVWPQLQKVIPEALGTAFSTVKYSSGELSNTIRLTAECPDSDGKTCESDELRVNGTVSVSARGVPEPILQGLQGWPVLEGMVNDTVNNLIKAYEHRDEENWVDPLQDWKSIVNASATVYRNKATTSKVVPNMKVPLDFLKAVLPNISLYDFVPPKGALEGHGEVKFGHGVIRVPQMTVSGVTLPFNDAFLTASATIRDVELEVESGVEDDDFLFGKNTPVGLDVPGVEFKFGCGPDCGKTGLTLSTGDAQLDMMPNFLSDILEGLRGIMRDPANVRKGSDLSASGPVPQEFSTPSARMPAFLEFNDIIQKAVVDVDASAVTLENKQFEIKTDLTLDTRVKLGKPFWRGVLDNSDMDWGYLQSTIAGRVGKLQDTGPPKDAAILRLVCGSVRVWYATKVPFQKQPNFEFDLADPGQVEKLQRDLTLVKTDGWSCILLKTHLMSTSYFCATTQKMSRLQHAIRIQVTRMEDAKTRWKAACYPSADGKKNVCDAKPDGTWFFQKEPYWPTTWQPQMYPPSWPEAVKSPMQLWEEARNGGD